MGGLTIHVDGYGEDIHMTYNTYHRLRSSIGLSYCTIRDHNVERWYGPLVNDTENPIQQIFKHNDNEVVFTKDEVKGIATILEVILDVDEDIVDYEETSKERTQLKEMRYVIINGKEHLQPFRPFSSISGKEEDTKELIALLEKIIDIFQYAENNGLEVVYK